MATRRNLATPSHLSIEQQPHLGLVHGSLQRDAAASNDQCGGEPDMEIGTDPDQPCPLDPDRGTAPQQDAVPGYDGFTKEAQTGIRFLSQPSPTQQPLLYPSTSRIQLRPISKPVATTTSRRAQDVIEHMCRLLREYMTKSKRQIPSMSIRLIVLGTSEDDAKPCLVIFCDDHKGNHARIQRFLRKPRATELYNPQDPSLASFDVHIVGSRPMTLQAKFAIMLDTADFHLPKGTLCGTPVRFATRLQPLGPQSTMGGILQIESPKGVTCLYGMTAAHGLENLSDPKGNNPKRDGDMNYDNESSSSYFDTIEDDDTFYDSDSPSSGSDTTEDDDGPATAIILEPWLSPVPYAKHDSPIIKDTYTRLGIVFSSLGNASTYSTRDWALFPVPIINQTNKMNILEVNGRPSITLQFPNASIQPSRSRPVAVITSHGAIETTISPCLSRLILKEGTDFIRAYTIEAENNLDIRYGDSGSWVADMETGEVYGHLVASDVLAGCYIIPFTDTLEEIEQRSRAVSICFPSTMTHSSLDNAQNSLPFESHLQDDWSGDDGPIVGWNAATSTESSCSRSSCTIEQTRSSSRGLQRSATPQRADRRVRRCGGATVINHGKTNYDYTYTSPPYKGGYAR